MPNLKTIIFRFYIILSMLTLAPVCSMDNTLHEQVHPDLNSLSKSVLNDYHNLVIQASYSQKLVTEGKEVAYRWR
jgi:hypothetical protein